MLIEIHVWYILRVMILMLPPAALVAVTVIAWRRGWHGAVKGGLTAAAFILLLFMLGHSVGNVLLMPHAVIRASGKGDDISVWRYAVLLNKEIAFNGKSYPARERDMIINDTDQLLIYEEVRYEMKNMPRSAFDVINRIPPHVELIPPGAVYEEDEGLGSRLYLEYTGDGEDAPPHIIHKQVPHELNTDLDKGFWGRSTQYWLHWKPWDERQYHEELLMKELGKYNMFERSPF